VSVEALAVIGAATGIVGALNGVASLGWQEERRRSVRHGTCSVVHKAAPTQLSQAESLHV
jgi:hypothetical protein